MTFDDSFFEGEERNGFYIRPMMKRVWAVELEIVSVLAEICERHNIRWFADSGTLLGAVREKGYIAWDDDIDLAMLRPDYEVFLKYVREELPEGWLLRNSRWDPAPYSHTLNIFNSDRIRIDPGFLEQNHGCPYGVGIDICVLDLLPVDEEEEEVFRLLATMAYDCFTLSQSGLLPDECDDEVKERIQALEETSGLEFDRSVPVKPQALQFADQISAMYYDDPQAADVAIIPFYTPNKYNRKPASAYASTIMMPFENMMLPVPAGYDTVLRVAYGDNYMTPVHAAPAHEYPNFAAEERMLRRHFEEQGVPFPAEFE
ncbi:MAG: LicD family protein [Lachnospiraceae bacterium]|nr:LicD family protein [Lachnospiraceae bacterium]